jgi:hypothetical protein
VVGTGEPVFTTAKIGGSSLLVCFLKVSIPKNIATRRRGIMMASATGKMAIAAPFALPDAATHKQRRQSIAALKIYRIQRMFKKMFLEPTPTTYQTECIYKRARQWRSQHKKLLKKVRK